MKVPIGTRLALAAKAFRGAFTEEAARAAHGLLSGLLPGGRGEPPPRGERASIAAYKSHPWVRTNVAKIATKYASVQWKLFAVRRARAGGAKGFVLDKGISFAPYRDRMEAMHKAARDGELTEITTNPLLDLVRRPVPFMLTGLTARKLGITYRILAGESFEVLERSTLRARLGRGMPVQAWPIPPHWVQSTPTPKNPTFKISYQAWNADVPMSDVLWNLSDPDTENPYGRGSGYVAAMGDELDADENAARLQNYAFYNRGRPDMIVTMEGADPEEVEMGRTAFNQETRGISKYLRSFWTNLKVTATPLAQDFKELDLLKLREFSRDAFRIGLGIPPEVLGILTNSNRATIDSADYFMAEHVLVPYLEEEREFKQTFLVPEFDERLILDYESPVREDKDFQLKVFTGAKEAFLVDEVRDLAGKSALENGGGQVHMKPFGVQGVSTLLPEEVVQQGLNGAQIAAATAIVVEVAAGRLPRDAGIGQIQVLFNLTPEQAEQIMGSAGTGEPTQPNPNPSAVPPPGADPEEEDLDDLGDMMEGDEIEDEDDPEAPPAPPKKKGRVVVRSLNTPQHWRGLVEKLHLPGEDRYARTYRRVVRGIRKDQVARVRAAGEGATPGAVLFDVKHWQGELSKATRPVYASIYNLAAAEMVDEIQGIAGKGVRFVRRKDATGVFLDSLTFRVGVVVETLSDRIERALQEAALRPGYTNEDLLDALEEAFDAYEDGGQIDVIALDQTAKTVSGARSLTMDEAGIELSEWLTAEDERVRDTHVRYGEAGPRPRGFNYADLVGGSYTLRHPHDDECDELGEVINCRCVEVPAIEGKSARVRRTIEETVRKEVSVLGVEIEDVGKTIAQAIAAAPAPVVNVPPPVVVPAPVVKVAAPLPPPPTPRRVVKTIRRGPDVEVGGHRVPGPILSIEEEEV